MRRLLLTLVPALVMLLVLLGSGLASAHTLAPKVPSTSCANDGCDGKQASAQTACGTSVRQYDVAMVAHNGTTVGHLYLYYFSIANGCDAIWGTYHLSSAIQSATIYSTRSANQDETLKNYSAFLIDPSTGVYHDAAMTGSDNDSPYTQDIFNAAIDWVDAQGFHIHTQTLGYGGN